MSGHHISTEGWPSVSKMVAMAQQMLQMWLFLAHPENYRQFDRQYTDTRAHWQAAAFWNDTPFAEGAPENRV